MRNTLGMRLKKGLFIVALIVSIERFCYYQKGTFSFSKMIHETSPASVQSPASSLQLQQPLRFIGAGKQFYAFETADSQYIVKFMKWSRRRPAIWSFLLPPTLKKQHLQERYERAQSIIRSSSLALDKLSLETALVIPSPVVEFTLIDSLGITYKTPANCVHFYVQRKAEPFGTYFKTHLEEAPQLISSFIQTVISQCQKGVAHLDPQIDRNYGVLDHQVIFMDIGSFSDSISDTKGAVLRHHIVYELLPLRSWLKKHFPQYLPCFDSFLKDQLPLDQIEYF